MKKTKLAERFHAELITSEKQAHEYRLLVPIVDSLPELPLPINVMLFHSIGASWSIGYASESLAISLADMQKCLKTMRKAGWLHRIDGYSVNQGYADSHFTEFTYKFTPKKKTEPARQLSYTPFKNIYMTFTVPLTDESEALITRVSKGKCRIVRKTEIIEPRLETTERKTVKLICDL